ncbi:unnamed protein product [Caenorhabditis auriculariae]|uniref:DNA replication complex GINS protein PSF1 n=1 Tax=Caenorhabditis auriculariae TaxID=2777116 RepID=A0A8S1HLP9_9PELO|nr:unnamed protein product [Caenorhabditis auriculariae]
MSANSEESGGVADKALQLVLEMKRNPDIMPPYNSDLVRQCLNKIDELYRLNAQELIDIRAGRQEDHSLLQARIVAMYHIRRCLCAYIGSRKDRIKSYRWKFGGVLPLAIKNALCDAEIEFFNEYSSTLANFQANLGESAYLFRFEHWKNYGEFETSDGTLVVLMKDSLHSLPRQDCEMLIRQGVLEVANS